ncbi:hypothetical protein NE237_015530 [Protea cynaroides]|uniref:Uncharacterized protein n=1 Tax=Protea cynaroides TaxID=273540 RepID=A0A9Q0KEE3_9MAGN|nr:hypothetical protein NE237_015530 [Protea cynaroides]
MEVSAIADAIAVTTTHTIGFENFIIRRHYFNSILCGSSTEPSNAIGLLSISAVIAPPAVRSNSYRTAPRKFTRHMKRTRRRTSTGDSEDGEEDGFFGDGDDGPFGGGRCGGSGGRGFDGYGGSDWEESSYSSSSDPALGFFYEVICWIALSNCLHFSFKKLVRIVADWIGDSSREKVPMRLASMC